MIERTEALLGTEGANRLASAHVAVCGLGGVGGHAFESLLRSGVGTITVIDHDTFDESNLNRQILATLPLVGKKKTEAAIQRGALINPGCAITGIASPLTPETTAELLPESLHCVIDAIDDVAAKTALLKYCVDNNIPAVSSMGAAGRMDATAITIDDISRSHSCPLARKVRKALREIGVHHGIPVVFSTETPATPGGSPHTSGSIAHITGIFGLMAAGECIRILTS